MLKTSDLKQKEIVNILDGKKLGTVTDIEIDVESGRLTSIFVPGHGRVFGLFGRNDEIVIPWEKIKKIGLDVVLVEAAAAADLKHYDD